MKLLSATAALATSLVFSATANSLEIATFDFAGPTLPSYSWSESFNSQENNLSTVVTAFARKDTPESIDSYVTRNFDGLGTDTPGADSMDTDNAGSYWEGVDNLVFDFSLDVSISSITFHTWDLFDGAYVWAMKDTATDKHSADNNDWELVATVPGNIQSHYTYNVGSTATSGVFRISALDTWDCCSEFRVKGMSVAFEEPVVVTPPQPPTSVPTPGSLGLFFAGALALSMTRKKLHA